MTVGEEGNGHDAEQDGKNSRPALYQKERPETAAHIPPLPPQAQNLPNLMPDSSAVATDSATCNAGCWPDVLTKPRYRRISVFVAKVGARTTTHEAMLSPNQATNPTTRDNSDDSTAFQDVFERGADAGLNVYQSRRLPRMLRSVKNKAEGTQSCHLL